MESSNNSSTSISVSFTGLLLFLFIVLKLTGVIAWSWWWVLSPIWIGLSIVGLVLLVGFVIVLITTLRS